MDIQTEVILRVIRSYEKEIHTDVPMHITRIQHKVIIQHLIIKHFFDQFLACFINDFIILDKRVDT
jgi:hypothetical protein